MLPLIQDGEYFITHNILTEYGVVNSAKIRLIAICTQSHGLISIDNLKAQKIVLTELSMYLLVKVNEI
jgi:hypothetical protein